MISSIYCYTMISLFFSLIYLYSTQSNAPTSINNLIYPNISGFCRGTPSASNCPTICGKVEGSGDFWYKCINNDGYICNPNNYQNCNNYIWMSYYYEQTFPSAIPKYYHYLIKIPPILPNYKLSQYENYYSNNVLLITNITNSVIYTKLINVSLLKLNSNIIWIYPKYKQYINLRYIVFYPNNYAKDNICCTHLIPRTQIGIPWEAFHSYNIIYVVK
jgi:hypothetical protein